MKAVLGALTLLLSLSACAVQSIPDYGPRRASQPLRAMISPPEFNGLSFYVNRPAHVAMFEIVPGRGTSLVYPSPGFGRMDGFVYPGAHHLGWVRRHNAEQYLPVSSRMTAGGPRFFFLIASERPLELDRFGGYGMGLHSSMGMHFASLNPYSAMESLARLALGTTADDGSWTSDMYVYWPQVLYDSRGPGLVQVRCNGYSMYVRPDYLASVRESVCGTRGADAPRPGSPQPGDSASGGEPRILEPQRRRPLPRQADDLGERVTSSTQLEEARRRRVAPRTRATDSGDRDRREVAPRAVSEPRVRSRPRAEPRSGDRGRSEASPAREPRSADRPRAEPRGSAEPRARPAEPSSRAPAEPSSRPTTRSGESPRVTPREPVCDPPCRQR